MISILQHSRRTLLILYAIFSLTLLSSCAYRFTNQYVRVPKGVKSIAIESIYDTSKMVLPHEKLWESLQESFVANGRLIVTTADKADLYLRVHLEKADSLQYDKGGKEDDKDPELTDNPPHPNEFRNLNRSSTYAKKERLAVSVAVEVINLHTKEILLRRNYSEAEAYGIIDTFTTAENQFLRAEEMFEKRFKNLSQRLAKRITSDFFRSLSYDKAI